MDTDVKRFDDVTRALTGLSDYTVVDAVTSEVEGLAVTVQLTASEAPCPECGEYSKRVKSCRTSIVRDAPCGGRPTVLKVVKRSFRCDGLGCPRKSFTETSDQVRARSRVTQRCREVVGRAGHDRSTASVAREYRISWATAWAAITIAAVLLLGQQPKRPVRRIGIDETRFWWKQPWLVSVAVIPQGCVGVFPQWFLIFCSS
jgi:transposase